MKNYEKARKMDEMKNKARAETGVWGSMVKGARAEQGGSSPIAEGDEEPAPAPAPLSRQGSISGPPDAAAAQALAAKMQEAETRAAESAEAP